MSFQSIGSTGVSRRAFLIMPVGFAGWLVISRRSERVLPNPAAEGTGDPVALVLFSDNQERREVVSQRKVIKSRDEWRRELSSDAYVVTREQATELPFTGRYWHNQAPGIYRCICCATALFCSKEKFDSGTGWPSFTAPVASENVYTQKDYTLREIRQELLCRKCDAHLGHVFPDGPPPTYLRYCINSAALSFLRQS